MRTPGEGAPAKLAEQREPLTMPATERVIPLRVIQVLNALTDADNCTLDDLQRNLRAANEVFNAAGVQFYISSYERLAMPTFADLDARPPEPLWQDVRGELSAAFPSLDPSAWPDVRSANEFIWTDYANTVWGSRYEVIIWIHKSIIDQNGATIHYGVYPEDSRAALHMYGPNMWGEPYKFAHELGHAIFGLSHTQDVPASGFRDPKDLTPRTKADSWDLMYTPSASHFSSFDEAAIAEFLGWTINPIDTGSNCSMVGGVAQCVVSGTTYQAGAAMVKGLAFQFPGGTTGFNVMSYTGDFTSYSYAFSDSQIQMGRKHLRYDMPLPQWRVDDIDPPPGVYPNSNRPDLGGWDVQRSGPWVNFDTDSGSQRRDLAVWDPPLSLAPCTPPTDVTGCGTFRILTSSSNFNTQWTVSFGKLGDVPFVQDYNNDGCTDIGVWRTSGPNATNPTNTWGHFVYCPSTKTGGICSAPTCSTIRTSLFGQRSDVPISDPRYHGAAGEIAVYRPSNKRFFWRTYMEGGDNDGFPAPSIVKIMTLSTYGGYIPLAGDYDDDGVMDPAVYSPQAATFQILRSGSNYQAWNRVFPLRFVPQDSTDPSNPDSEETRAGAFPIEGVGILLFNRPALYFPKDGTWNVMWDNTTSTVTSCAWGGDDHFPIPSIDRDNDWRTDMVTFSGRIYGGNGELKFKDSAFGGCTGSTITRSSTLWDRPRMKPFAVWDMTGDGKVDIILIDPDTMTFYWPTSESDYSPTSVQTRQLGDQRSIPL